MPHYIEILGSSGSGKTTISNKLLDLLNKNKFEAYHSNRTKQYKKFDQSYTLKKKFFLFFLTTSYLIKYYLKFYSILLIKKNIPKNYYFRMLKLHFIHTYNFNYLKFKCKKNEIIIVEPGPIMFLLHDFFYTDSLISKKYILKSNYFFDIDTIFYLECSRNNSYMRVNKRKTGLPLRMRNISKEHISCILDNSKRNIDEYILYSNKRIEAINSNSLSPSDIVNKIYTKLLSLNIKNNNH